MTVFPHDDDVFAEDFSSAALSCAEFVSDAATEAMLGGDERHRRDHQFHRLHYCSTERRPTSR